MSRENYIVRRTEMAQEDLEHLRSFVAGGKEKIVSLRGMWEGADIPDEDAEEANRSLFKAGHNIDVDC